MKSKEVEIIRLLIDKKTSELSINQIAKLLKKDYKNAHNIVTRLSKMQLVSLQPFGRSYKVCLASKAHPLIYEAECIRRNDILKNKDISVMYDSFMGLKSRLFVLLLFGSYAKKTQTKQSDIDLLFIVPDESEDKMEKAIQNLTGTLPLRIHSNIFRETDFLAMKNSKQTTVGSEAINNNVILHGIELYYEMIK
jgi:predicted nucleotidyltransferase